MIDLCLSLYNHLNSYRIHTSMYVCVGTGKIAHQQLLLFCCALSIFILVNFSFPTVLQARWSTFLADWQYSSCHNVFPFFLFTYKNSLCFFYTALSKMKLHNVHVLDVFSKILSHGFYLIFRKIFWAPLSR